MLDDIQVSLFTSLVCLRESEYVWRDSQVVYDKKRKSEGKMVRAERQVVLDMLFSAFEKHQYYNFKELVDITKQPVVSGHANAHTCTNAHKCMCSNIAGKTEEQYTCPLSTLSC